MKQKSGIHITVFVIVGALIALKVFAAQPTVDEIKLGTDKIDAFRQCVNNKIKTKRNTGETTDISDTVQCLPAKCSVTLTMSDRSAQKACLSGGAANHQLPRVIMKCSGPPQFEPSYLLCPMGSEGTDNITGSNKVEIGVTVGKVMRDNMEQSVMVMADIPVPPSVDGNIKDVLSIVPDSKGCNICHRNGNPNAGNGLPQFSEKIEVSGTFGIELSPFIIYTNDPKVKKKLKGVKLSERLKKQTLSEICQGIDKAIKGPMDAGDKLLANPEQTLVVKKLCRNLEDYQKTRGI